MIKKKSESISQYVVLRILAGENIVESNFRYFRYILIKAEIEAPKMPKMTIDK